MKKKTKQFWKGLSVGLFISAVSNLITFSDLQIINILVGGGIGVAIFFLFDINGS